MIVGRKEEGSNKNMNKKYLPTVSHNNKMTLITKDQHFKIVNDIWKDFQFSDKIV